jgi:hypothetical protein
VTESIDLEVNPQSLVVLNRPGAQRRRIVVTNQGNVPFAIGELGDVDLENDLLPERTRLALEPVRGSAQPATRDLDGPVFALVSLVPADAVRERGLSVRVHGPTVRVMPGETAVIELDVTVQAELPPNSRYRGRAALLTRDLEFVVVSSSAAPNDSAADTRPSKAAKPKRRPT